MLIDQTLFLIYWFWLFWGELLLIMCIYLGIYISSSKYVEKNFIVVGNLLKKGYLWFCDTDMKGLTSLSYLLTSNRAWPQLNTLSNIPNWKSIRCEPKSHEKTLLFVLLPFDGLKTHQIIGYQLSITPNSMTGAITSQSSRDEWSSESWEEIFKLR